MAFVAFATNPIALLAGRTVEAALSAFAANVIFFAHSGNVNNLGYTINPHVGNANQIVTKLIKLEPIPAIAYLDENEIVFSMKFKSI